MNWRAQKPNSDSRITGPDRESWLPDFFILGASKCATSSLYAYLDQHPQLHLSATKELRILDAELDDDAGIARRYRTAYAAATDGCLLGDASPSYFHWPNIVLPRLERLYPWRQPKFIVLFRNPIDRAWSHYLHVARLGYRWESFTEALRREPGRAAAIESELTRRDQPDYAWSGYVAEGLYARQLKLWLRIFDREQFLFVVSEDLQHDPTSVMRRAFEFLAVPVEVAIDVSERHNTRLTRNPVPAASMRRRAHVLVHRLRHPLRTLSRALGKNRFGPAALANASMTPNVRQMLVKCFTEDVRELRSLTGLDLTLWKDFS